MIMKNKKSDNLLLLMTPGIGLSTWKKIGILNRELAPYVEYVKQGWTITIATYDNDIEKIDLPDGIDCVKCWHHRLLFAAPWFLRKSMKSANLVKTNQSYRSWWYVLAARIHKKPIILRCGWLPGSYRENSEGMSFSLRSYRNKEGWAFRHASKSQVATLKDREWVIQKYHVLPGNISVKPNFIDIDIFKPRENVKVKKRSVISVGRLDKVKRYDLLIKACSNANISRLIIIGEGDERNALELFAKTLDVPLLMPGRLDQKQLPVMLQESEVFALTSTVEGHPKALLEAMACGVPCIGTETPGITECIQNQKTGLLCESTPESISNALQSLFGNKRMKNHLSKYSVAYIHKYLTSQIIFSDDIKLSDRVKNDHYV